MQYSKAVVWLLLSAITTSAAACDLCSMYLGINPGDYRNSFGLINRIRVFESVYSYTEPVYNPYARVSHVNPLPDDGIRREKTLKEQFVSYDLRTRFFINQRWQLNFTASFVDNYQYEDDSLTGNVSGVGDITGLVSYQLFSTKSAADSVTFIHRLAAGGGIKAPTGSFNKPGWDKEVDPHIQPGTGSLDYIIMTEYLCKYGKIGLNGNVIYKINSVNRNGFRFANRLNWNAAMFYLSSAGKFKWMPTAGLSFESGERDRLNGERYLGSGGESLFGTLGFQLFYKQFSVAGTYYSKPLHEDLYDQPMQLQNKYRFISELTCYF